MNFEEIMAFNPPYNEENFNELVRSIQAGQVVPYIGAGMSMLFKDIYPTWGDFLNRTSEKYLQGEDKALFEALVGYEEKADFLYEELGQVTFSRHMKDIFGEAHLDNKHEVEFMDKSVYLMPIIFDKGLLITTNYDKALEKNYSFYNKTLSVTHPGHFEALNNAIRDRALVLFKIHGDISEPITSIVLTKEQYERAYGKLDLIKMLTQVYQNNTILFLGCSLEKDRPLELLAQVSQAGMGHYAIIPVSKSNKKDKRKNLEREYYTQGILYPDGEHECVRIVLERIAEIVAPEAYEQFKAELVNVGEEGLLSDKLTEEWFQNQNKYQVDNLGDRYLPDLHVELEISSVFEATGRTEKFKIRFEQKSSLLFQIVNELIQKIEIDEVIEYIEKLKVLIAEFLGKENELLKYAECVECLKRIEEAVDRKIKEYIKMLNEGCEDEEKVRRLVTLLEHTGNCIDEYKHYFASPEVQAVNRPYILLHGKGGMGKSHILAHTIELRKTEGYKSLLLLGQHFRSDTIPLAQMMEILEIKGEFEKLLDSLNAIGEKEQKRLVIFIDALNEGAGIKIWKEHISGLIEKVKHYPWIGLVISIRSEYIPIMMDNNSKLKENLIVVKHTGFSTIEHKAVKKFFDFYGIHYSDIPMLNQEFTNPLFLRIACEAYKGKTIELDTVSFFDIYEKYLQTINLRICESCGYSPHIEVVKEVLNAMVTYKYEIGKANNMIPQGEMLRIILKVAEPYGNKHLLIEQLFAVGIINKSISFARNEYIHITYEKLEDYIYAKQLVKNLRKIGKESFTEKYKHLLSEGDRLDVFAVVLSEEKGFNQDDLEIFDIFYGQDKNPIFVNAFISALKWRKTSSITEHTFHYINSIILRYREYTVSFYETIISIATKVNHCLNAMRTVEHILSMPMPNRDARFIPIFNEIYKEDKSSIHQLINWCFEIKNYTNIGDEAIELAAMMIATFLLSSNRNLRDMSTKALVSLLTGKIETVIALLRRYEKVDDPYIYERLYAVAFGCVVSEQSEKMIEELAQYVYKTIFEKKYVYPNILVRDYAKNIVDYAKYRVGSSEVKDMNVNPPYQSVFPNIPSDKTISNYEYDYNSPEFKDYYWSQNDIISSMRVEYSRDGQPGGYGDFGRYTFQSYFSDWDNLDYNDLMNIAVKKIFDMGYDVEKHGKFDRNVPYDRGSEKVYERIGKKYQWIALYELAAQVADKYKLSVHTDEYGTTKWMYCKGSFNPNIRDIDPTILINGHSQNSKEKTIHNTLFQYESIANNEWVKSFNDLLEINKMVNREYEEQAFILLNGWYIWKEETGELRYQNPKKDMWVQINSYIVKNEQLHKIVNALQGKDFMGRWLAEPNHNYVLYNKEYYWSEGYEFFKNPYYCGEEWVPIDRYNNQLSENYEVLLPTYEYMTERQGDLVEEGVANSWHKPCSELFYGLKLQYGEGNSILYDAEGKVMCFESSELLNEDIGFFIKKESLLQYLNEKGYSIFWTILAEKRILEEPHSKRTYGTLNKSWVYTINDEGMLVEVCDKNE